MTINHGMTKAEVRAHQREVINARVRWAHANDPEYRERRNAHTRRFREKRRKAKAAGYTISPGRTARAEILELIARIDTAFAGHCETTEPGKIGCGRDALAEAERAAKRLSIALSKALGFNVHGRR